MRLIQLKAIRRKKNIGTELFCILHQLAFLCLKFQALELESLPLESRFTLFSSTGKTNQGLFRRCQVRKKNPSNSSQFCILTPLCLSGVAVAHTNILEINVALCLTQKGPTDSHTKKINSRNILYFSYQYDGSQVSLK